MEMVFSNKNEKKFELRDLTDSIEVTEIMPLELPPLPFSKKFIPAKFNSRQQSRDSSEEDEGIEDEPGEEKVHRYTHIQDVIHNYLKLYLLKTKQLYIKCFYNTFFAWKDLKVEDFKYILQRSCNQ